ncbi:MAG: hypothetical protein LUP93_07125 [Methanomicrobiales archaeon]|nr:hypothetical protein [Methanomicrobiales archaeon]
MPPDTVNAAERGRLTLIRQFMLASRELEMFAGWNHSEPGRGYHLYAHPELPVRSAGAGETGLTLIGYFIDPLHPEWDDSQVLAHLAEELDAGRDPHDATEYIGGRWILLLSRPETCLLIPDSCALRQAYYGRTADGSLYVASQPGLLERVPGTRVGDGLLVDRFGLRPPETLPSGDMEVFRLLPNHRLDLVSGRSTRFWPRKPFSDIPLDDGVARSATLFRQELAAIAHRYQVAATLTAGFDSRIMLSALRGKEKGIRFYVNRHIEHPEGHRDQVIPAKIAADLGLDFRIIDTRQPVEDWFRELFRGNISYFIEGVGGENRAHEIAAVYRSDVAGRMGISGVVSELTRAYFYTGKSNIPYPKSITASSLEGLNVWWGKRNRVERKDLEAWLEDARAVEGDFNIRLLDLFYWEHLLGRILATMLLEYDLVSEHCAPYNNRFLLSTILQVPVRYRSHPDYLFHARVIEHLWPELLQYPINPASLWERLRLLGVAWATRTGTRGLGSRLFNLVNRYRY